MQQKKVSESILVHYWSTYNYSICIVSVQLSILSLVLPVRFGHITACQSSPGVLCSDPFRHETFRPLFRRPTPFPIVLGCSRLLVGVDAGSSEVVQETSHPFFSLPPYAARAPHQFSEHHALRQFRIHHKPREQDPSRLDALTSRLDERVQIVGNREVGAIVLPPTDAASQEAAVGSSQRIVVARARASRDAVVQHCHECLGS